MKKGNTPKYEILALLVLAFIVIAQKCTGLCKRAYMGVWRMLGK